MRKIAFTALVGSKNCNLDTKESDSDYKVIVLPTFDDLYRNITYSETIIGEKEDFDFHDIRKIVNLFWKSNINYIQVLYSKEIKFSGIEEIDKMLKEIFKHRDQIATMNLPYLYSSCHGMHLEKMKQITHGTAGTQHLVDKFGYDCKQFLHAFRMLDFVQRFANSGFKNFERSIRYDNGHERDNRLNMKNGFYTLEEAREIIRVEYQEFKAYEEIYKSQPVKEDVKKWLEEIVYKIVRYYTKIEMEGVIVNEARI